MARINYSDNLSAKGRQLHLQTHVAEDGGERVHTLFDSGRVLRRISVPLHRSASTSQQDEEAFLAHEEIRSEIELLYQISVRIKTVRHAPSLLALGRLFLKWRLLDEAVSELELARILIGSGTEGLLELSEAFQRRGGLSEALAALESGLKKPQGYADFWVRKGQLQIELGQWQESLESFNEAVKRNSNYGEAYLRMAQAHLLACAEPQEGENRRAHLEKAREHIGRALHRGGLGGPEAEAIVRLLHKKDEIKALSQLSAWLETRPWALQTDGYDRFYLDYLYGEQGRDAQRIQTHVQRLEEVVADHPDYADLHNRLGIAYMIQCRLLITQAIAHFQSALKLNPAYKRAKRNLQLVKNDSKGFLILLRALLK